MEWLAGIITFVFLLILLSFFWKQVAIFLLILLLAATAYIVCRVIRKKKDKEAGLAEEAKPAKIVAADKPIEETQEKISLKRANAIDLHTAPERIIDAAPEVKEIKSVSQQPRPICRTMEHDLSTNIALRSFQSYVVLDFETTGFSPQGDKIIEFAVTRVEAGEVMSQWDSFVNPGCHIPPIVTKLTGIRDADVADAPSIEKIIFDLRDFIGDAVVVAHNAPFDISFLHSAYRQHGIAANTSYVDTLPLAKRAFPGLKDYKLQTLIQFFNLAECQTHRAMDDVDCTQKLLCLCIQALENAPGKMTPGDCVSVPAAQQSRTSSHPTSVSPRTVVPATDSFDTSHPLYEKKLVFTGELSVSRKAAMQMAVDVGAVVRSSVSKKTDYLIVGEQDVSLVGSDGLSTKEERAYELIRSGVPIKIIREEEFVSLVSGKEVICNGAT